MTAAAIALVTAAAGPAEASGDSARNEKAGNSGLAPHPNALLPQKTHFDLQAHRGGIGMTTEETHEGFPKALELGVTTLELDTQITKDGAVVVTHDRGRPAKLLLLPGRQDDQ
jgi:glycerophosphoryl diester phosphodiesterase